MSFVLPLAASLAAALSGGELSLTVRTPKGDPVADAVVSLQPAGQTAPPPAPGTAVEIGQQGQEFSTSVTVVQMGTKVVFPNNDKVQHHVYSLSKAKKFELPLYNPGAADSFVFDAPGVVALGCNIHDWMLAYLVVVPTPYFAKTDAAGQARVQAPAGRYHLELWHPRLALKQKQDIDLPESGDLPREFAVDLKPDRRIRRGPDSKAGEYR